VRFYAQLVERAAALPGVRGVGVSSRLPLFENGMNVDPVYVEGDVTRNSKIPPLEIFATVDSGYFGAMHIPIIAGRNFDRMDRQHGNEAIISQEAARVLFHDSTGRAALNKQFRELPNASVHTIVGIAGSVRDTSLFQPPSRALYLPESVGGDTLIDGVNRTMAIVARTSGDVTGTTRALQRLVHDLDPTLPTFDVRSMQANVDASIAHLTFTMIVLGVAAGVTLMLAIVGLYGVIAYIVNLRTRELGVRIALGAQPRAVAGMVTRQALTVCGAGLVAGLVLTMSVAGFLRSFLYGVAPTDPLTLTAAAALLVCLAVLAAWIPARRAASVSPIEALRAD
jgi:predicted permease